MGGLHIQREETTDTVTLKLVGNFNRQSALELFERLPAPDHRTIVLDFSKVGELPDLAVPQLSRFLGARKVRLHGLARHQARMFGYFGLGAARSEPVYYTPEEVLAS
jgi:hypothetical protein